MPWEAKDAEKHTKKADTPKKQRQWAAVANSALSACLKDGKDQEGCEASAIKQANAAVSEEAAMIKDIDYFISLAEQAVETATAAISGGTRTMKELAEKNGKTVAEVADKLLADIWAELAEAKAMKTVGGEKYPASDFLAVEDPEKPSTWHLQVKKNGTPDHALMGAAKAALTSPGGHRGNKYEGPDKEKAISALKALYKAEDMPWSSSKESDDDMGREGDVTQEYGESPETAAPELSREYGPVSFADLDAEEEARQAAADASKRVYQYHRLIDSIMQSPEVNDKGAAFLGLANEFVKRIEMDSQNRDGANEISDTDAAESDNGSAEFEEVEVNETAGTTGVSITGHALSIAEVGDVATGGTKPLKMEVVPIRPGWGNRRDNNYYSEDALKNGAGLFSRVKMFETNHVDEETNNRNWVSTIIETPRFTESGEPVSVVGVHDPGFAQKVLNLSELDLLGMLECSIRGHGRVRSGEFELDGRTGKYVEELTDISSVDWVSKAGAGGRALGLAENDTGGGNMSENEERNDQEPTAPAEEQEQEVETEEVVLGEESPDQEPQALTEAEVSEALANVALPEHTKALLSAREYADADELDATVKQVVAEFKQATGSGKPPATRGEHEAPKPPDQATIEKAQDAINQRWIKTRIKEEQK